MISVSEAISVIQKNIRSLHPAHIALSEAADLILLEDIFSPGDIPAYAQSSMDGYAMRYSEKDYELTIIGEMAAGVSAPMNIKQLEAARIFTGAPLPEGADTVLMQECAVVNNRKLTVNDPKLKEGLFVRPKGSEIKKGELALAAGTKLTVGAIGFLAGIGIDRVNVFPLPAVSIILTGNELQRQGSPLEYGKVYDANSFMLKAALEKGGIKTIRVSRANDNMNDVAETLGTALQTSDLVLLTGGVSVGDYDFVVEAAAKLNVEQKFHRISQKPGKPLYFGMKGDKIIFGLPGNPSSALSCYLLYVIPALRAMTHHTQVQTAFALLSHDHKKPPALTHFLKAKVAGNTVTLLHAQESYRLHSFAQANCLAELKQGVEFFEAGDAVPVHMLRFEL